MYPKKQNRNYTVKQIKGFKALKKVLPPLLSQPFQAHILFSHIVSIKIPILRLKVWFVMFTMTSPSSLVISPSATRNTMEPIVTSSTLCAEVEEIAEKAAGKEIQTLSRRK